MKHQVQNQNHFTKPAQHRVQADGLPRSVSQPFSARNHFPVSLVGSRGNPPANANRWARELKGAIQMKYLALLGLIIMLLGSFLPFRFILMNIEYLNFWWFPITGIFLMFLLKNGSLNNSRYIAGIFGLLTLGIASIDMMETLSFPPSAGVLVGTGIPILIFGSLLACLGGLSKYERTTNSLLYAIGMLFIFLGFIATFVLAMFASIFRSETLLLLPLSTYEALPTFETLSLIVVLVGVIIVFSKFIKTFFVIRQNRLQH